MIKSWEALRGSLSDFENRIAYLEALHLSSNSHLLNNDNNDMIEIYRSNSRDDIKFLVSYIKFQRRILNDISMLQKAQHGLEEYVKSLSGKVTLLEEKNTRVLNTNRYNKYK